MYCQQLRKALPAPAGDGRVRLQGLIEDILSRIAGGGAAAMLEATWHSQRDTRCVGVDWERYSLQELQVGGGCSGVWAGLHARESAR